jgi:hypothetical protein
MFSLDTKTASLSQASQSDKASSTSLFDSASQPTSTGWGRLKSSLASRLSVWTSKDSTQSQDGPSTIQVARIKVPYITIHDEDRFLRPGAMRIGTESSQEFMNVFQRIISQNHKWFQGILSEKCKVDPRRLHDLPLVIPKFYHLVLRKRVNRWRGSLQQENGSGANFYVAEEDVSSLAESLLKRSAYMLWPRDGNNGFVLVFRPVENFNDGRHIISFSLYLEEECNFAIQPAPEVLK